MKLRVCVTLLLLVAGAHTGLLADSAVLHPSDVVAIQPINAQVVRSGAMKFDLSQIPANARIDLAELKVFLDVDAGFGETATLSFGVVTEEWTGSQLPQSNSVATSDSLSVFALVETGENKVVEVDLTEFVSLWHRAAIANYGVVVSSPGNEHLHLWLAGVAPSELVTLTIFYTVVTSSQ